jgi:hypothetical protein
MTARDPIRITQVTRDTDGFALGAAVFFSAAELAALGVDPATTDRIAVHITDEAVEITHGFTEGSDE